MVFQSDGVWDRTNCIIWVRKKNWILMDIIRLCSNSGVRAVVKYDNFIDIWQIAEYTSTELNLKKCRLNPRNNDHRQGLLLHNECSSSSWQLDSKVMTIRCNLQGIKATIISIEAPYPTCWALLLKAYQSTNAHKSIGV